MKIRDTIQFIETGAPDSARFQAIISGHGLLDLWNRFEEQFPDTSP